VQHCRWGGRGARAPREVFRAALVADPDVPAETFPRRRSGLVIDVDAMAGTRAARPGPEALRATAGR